MKLMRAQLRAAERPIKLPEIALPPPAPPDPPPPGMTASDVADAEREARKRAGQRSGFVATMLQGTRQPGAAGMLGGSGKLG